MKSLKQLNLQTKFLLGLMAVMLLGGLLIAGAMHFHLERLLESEVSTKAELVLDQVESVQHYVSDVLRPVMYDLLEPQEFLIEAMSSSYISRKVMENVELANYDYSYRRVAINARNPNSEANPRELELIDHFRDNPTSKRWEGFKTIKGKEYYVQARPVRFNEGCMNCHGVPSDAPKALIERYGDKRGFGHYAGQVWGLTEIVLPVHGAMLQIRDAIYGTIFFAVLGCLFCLMMASVLFNRLVVASLRRVVNVFPQHFAGGEEAKLLDRLTRGDEIDELVHGVEDLASHLAAARRKLEDYAVNLKQMVDDRTAELATEASERRRDVQLFVNLLAEVGSSQTRRELITTTLPQIAERYGAETAAFICVFASNAFYSWPDPAIRPPLPDNWAQLVAGGKPLLHDRLAFIPVQSSQDLVDGLLYLAWPPDGPNPAQMETVLVALGRQLGIALENLDVLDSLLRHNDLLESVIQGISDPLLLMDGSCQVVLANEAARGLPGDDPETSMAELLGIGPASGGRCPLKLVLEQGRPHFSEILLPDNRSFELNVYPLPDSPGRERRAVVYARENTMEKRMLAQMQQSEKMVTVGKLAAGLAHEINNPLGVIQCYAELLLASAKDEQERSDVKVILHHTKQAQKVLQELLNFARPKKILRGPLNIAPVIANVLDAFRVQAQARGVEFLSAIPGDLPAIKADQTSLEQILGNLLINSLDAVTAMPRQEPCRARRVEVRAKARDGQVFLSVADNGPGIPPEHVPRLFDPFFTTKAVGQGTGLGLAVVYGLVQDLGGRVAVHNDNGAIFTLSFPSLEDAASPIEAQEHAHAL